MSKILYLTGGGGGGGALRCVSVCCNVARGSQSSYRTGQVVISVISITELVAILQHLFAG